MRLMDLFHLQVRVFCVCDMILLWGLILFFVNI